MAFHYRLIPIGTNVLGAINQAPTLLPPTGPFYCYFNRQTSRKSQEEIQNLYMKTLIEVTTSRTSANGSISSSDRYRKLAPLAIPMAMVCVSLLLDAVLPLRALWFYEALLTQLGSWPVLPSQILFPGWQLIPPLPHLNYIGVPQVVQSWEKLPLLLASFIIVFLVYLLALRQLPEHITKRYLLR